jgi:hypothetical protein
MKVVLATGKTGLGITRELAAALLVTAVAVGLKKSANPDWQKENFVGTQRPREALNFGA